MRYSRGFAIGAIVAAVAIATIPACSSDRPTNIEQGEIPKVTLSVQAPAVLNLAGVVVNITASDLSDTLRLNIPVQQGEGSGVIEVPPGARRTFTAYAFSSSGQVTHTGQVVADIEPGTNPVINLSLDPAEIGQVPVDVHVGNFSVTLDSAAATLSNFDRLQLHATVRNAAGVTIANAQVAWASSNPGVALVDATGLVSVVSSGSVVIAAQYRGSVAVMNITAIEDIVGVRYFRTDSTGALLAEIPRGSDGTVHMNIKIGESATLRFQRADGELLPPPPYMNEEPVPVLESVNQRLQSARSFSRAIRRTFRHSA